MLSRHVNFLPNCYVTHCQKIYRVNNFYYIEIDILSKNFYVNKSDL